MNFSEALVAIKDGYLVAREGWNGPDQFVFMVSGSTFSFDDARAPLQDFMPEGEDINYQPHIDIRNQQGQLVPWLASQGDLFAEDWKLVETPNGGY